MTERNLNFDRIFDRKNTDCLKYDFAVKRGMPEDVLPLWVADMDFETSSYIEDVLVERAKMGIYGYSEMQTPYFQAVAKWMKIHHNWEPKEEWLVKTPGVVFALAMAVKAFTPSLGTACSSSHRFTIHFRKSFRITAEELSAARWCSAMITAITWMWRIFEEKLKAENVKLFFLCNPHNRLGESGRKRS